MAMAAKVTALQVGVTGLRCCRTFWPRCRTPAVGPRRACPPWLVAVMPSAPLAGPCCRTPLSDFAVGPHCRTPISDPADGLPAVGLSHTAV